ncbi:MAG TPA: MFS transporter [Sphingomonadaceae bacterium]|nr:MFS transporter [Sphingomonadaceae bacterium]
MAGQAQSGDGETLDVASFLGGLKISGFHKWLIFLSCLVTFFDGLDFSLMTYTLPYVRDEMGLNTSMMGLVSSAAFAGQMVGSLAGSYMADVMGRRPVILLCTVLGAALTFITGYASSPEMLITLRFLGGLAIGGLLAPAWSLNIEAMPFSLRATSVTIIMLGFSLGGAAAGQVTNLIAPHYGWEGVFFFCGVATFALAIVLQFTLPESARWMVARGRPVEQVLPLLQRFDPGLVARRITALALSDEKKSSGEAPWTKFLALFKGPLLFITPIIWVTYFFSSFAIYLKTSFGILFLEKLGIPLATATNLGSIGGILGAIGGVFLLGFTEKRGPIWIAIAPLLGVPLAVLIGMGHIDGGALFIPVILLGSITIGVGHAAVISITSIYYPSAIRSTGGGIASFMAKFAAVAAPNIGAAWFLADRQAVLDGYLFTALCLTGVVAGIVALSFFARKLPTAHVHTDPEPEPA